MAEVLNPERPEKLSIVVFSGDFDKVHYALVMASAAAAIDTPVTLFFTMEGARALMRPGVDNVAAWSTQPTSSGLETGADMNDTFVERGVADFETLLSACRELGVRFMVCEMGLKALDLKRGELRPDITIEIGGVVTFLNDAHKDGAIIFI
ncbi:DsrE/DsrF/DrsH-like family protein [Magnetovibrio sp.]|uniref:DsrE/DsrF/DrsH-like family protein n=1 Tax=Magnetovibrio sp. TaxID=2024836 RepID=UPI002F9407E7